MVSLKKLVASMIGTCGLAFSAYANTSIDTSNQAPLQVLFPNAYSQLELKHYRQTQTKSDEMDVTNQVRYTLGSTFFNEDLDVQVVLGVNNNSSVTNLLSDRGTRVVADYNVYDNGLFSVTPNLEVRLPVSGNEGGTRVLLGWNTELNHELNATTGSFYLNTGWDFISYFSTKETSVDVTDNGEVMTRNDISNLPNDIQDKFSLTDNQVVQTTQAAPTLRNELTAGVSYAPNAVKGLLVSANAYWSQKMTPKMTWNAESRSVESPSSGLLNTPEYASQSEVTWGAVAQYQLNDTTVFAVEGYLGEAVYDKSQYKMLGTLSVSLF